MLTNWIPTLLPTCKISWESWHVIFEELLEFDHRIEVWTVPGTNLLCGPKSLTILWHILSISFIKWVDLNVVMVDSESLFLNILGIFHGIVDIPKYGSYVEFCTGGRSVRSPKMSYYLWPQKIRKNSNYRFWIPFFVPMTMLLNIHDDGRCFQTILEESSS